MGPHGKETRPKTELFEMKQNFWKLCIDLLTGRFSSYSYFREKNMKVLMGPTFLLSPELDPFLSLDGSEYSLVDFCL